MSKLESKIRSKIFPLILSELKTATTHIIEEKKPTIVGATGSAGKSSFIYLLDAVMKDELRTKTTFNGNSETGLPLEILGIRDYLHNYTLKNWLLILAITPFAYLASKLSFNYELLIAEMGIDSSQPPKNMSYLLEMIMPTIGVFLSVSNVHSQQFAEELGLHESDKEAIIRAIAAEKGKIVTELPNTATAIINIDSEYIRELIPKIKAHLVTFGTSEKADFQFTDYSLSEDSTIFEYRVGDKTYKVELHNSLLSEAYGLTILSVIATAKSLNVGIEKSIEKIQDRFTLPPGRMSLLKTEEGATIIDSSYNSSPIALTSMLKAIQKYPAKGRRILVLGDMRELGPLAAQAHKEIIDLVSQIADEVFLVGPLMREYVLPGLLQRGIPTHSALASLGVGDEIRSKLKLTSDDILLIKGSQNTIYLEQVVLELMAEPERALSLLCRQSEHWDKVRNAYFQTQRPR